MLVSKDMKINVNKSLTIAIVATIMSLTSTSIFSQSPTPGYNNPIPEKILTPDRIETRIGTLNFTDGLPDAATVQKVYDNLDFSRGMEVFLNFIPATSIEGIRLGMVELGATQSNQVVIFDQLMDSDPLFLTGNTDTVYASVILDLAKDGPTVVEVPAGSGPGTVNDAFFRFVIDMGAPGPDRGEGGKYLIIPAGYEGDIPEGYFVAESPSNIQWLILRGFLVDGLPDAASAMYRNGLKVYPLADVENPPTMEFINGSNVAFNTIHANTYEFYEELHDVIEREPLSFIDPELRGLAASIGIQKGKPFAPDARLQEILEEAVAIGNATARAILFRPREEGAFKYDDDRGWFTPFVGGSYQWLKDDGLGGRYLDARTMYFYGATVNTPAMTLKIPGVGSQYAYNATDTDGNFLDGSKNYTLNIPANVPAVDFWSVVAYDPQSRSELQTNQEFPSKNNKKSTLDYNADGSVDLVFGPRAPSGSANNWIETVPGKGWMVLIRLYGPLEPWFDNTWRPGDIELVE